MKVSDYIAEYLVNLGVTDVFGIPGGVILDLIYAFDAKEGITPHLSYHEQCAGLAACGYAQSSGKLGIAYATRGPGFTNLITAIADAYYDSIPTLFITAHSASCPPEGMRVIADQEIDTCSMVSNITKYTARIDLVEDFLPIFNDACRIAMEGRKGPVFLDIATNLLKKELKYQEKDKDNKSELVTFNRTIATNLVKNIQSAKRPVLLLGDGINQRNIANKVRAFISSAEIPVISSRFSHDIASGSPFYYGYIGSHAVRTANFILSKCDLIISLGNRLHFPPTSESFSCILDHAKILRFDIDDNEFIRDIKNSQCYKCDVADLINELPLQTEVYGNHSSWIEICNRLDKELHYADINPAVDKIANILGKISRDFIVVNDVGNNEFWVSRASVLLGISNRVMYSKSFGVLGCGLGKAIGAHYGTNKPVICFIGDQGLLMNIQELQYIAQHSLPIAIVLVNNESSGMIKDKEISTFGRPLHTTTDSGYITPNFKKVIESYGIPYIKMENANFTNIDSPFFMEIQVDANLVLYPYLPKGNKCQDLLPSLPPEKYNYLMSL